ncbi:hypothetical protein ACEUZ9_004697 [Paracoccus litorisediminis]|uniref:hypothetical protein n=1 Tax=Paracoccus litorisediminis TaxID=2006130 RepID=UPI0037338CD4
MAQQDGGIDGVLPETIAKALISASEEISGTEVWVPRRRSEVMSAIPRLMAIVMASRKRFDPTSRSGRIIRESSLRVMAYFPADLRLTCLLDLAVRNPLALDDLMSGEIGPTYQVYRYNILSSLGVFARHGLVEEVFTRERVTDVGRIVDRARRARKA